MGTAQRAGQAISVGADVNPEQPHTIIHPGPVPGTTPQVGPRLLGHGGSTPSVIVDLLRPDDLLNLYIEGHNLKLDTGDPTHPRLVRANAAAPAYLAIQFPLQHIQKQAFFEMQDPSPGAKVVKLLPSEPDVETPSTPCQGKVAVNKSASWPLS
jgi:hypothetical protein